MTASSPKAPGKAVRKRRKKRGEVPVNESTVVAESLFEQGGAAMLDDGEFVLFRKIARQYLCDDPARPAPPATPGKEALFAKALFELLGLAAGKLAIDRPAAAARAIDVYVAEVLPRAWAAGQRPPDGSDLAAELAVTRLLSEETKATLMQGAPAAGPATAAPTPEPEPEAAAEPAVEPPAPTPEAAVVPKADALFQAQGGARIPGPSTWRASDKATPEDEPAADAGAAAAEPMATMDVAAAKVDYAEIRRACLIAKSQKRKVVALVGLSTTGKSFLLKRLMIDEKREYSPKHLKGLATVGAQAVPRTKEVHLYRFNRIDGRQSKNVDVYDVPGDQFVALVRNGFVVAPGDRDTLGLLYTICAFADAIIFVAPALEVLKGADFLEHGDGLGLNRHERQERIRDIDTFITCLDPMTKVMALLRERLDEVYRAERRNKVPPAKAREAAADKAVADTMKMTFEELEHAVPRRSRLNMPALLLLSRADELRSRIPSGRDSFDYDPILQLLRRRRDHLDHLAGRFDAFSVDFLTAEDGHQDGVNFNPRAPSWGARNLIKDWLLDTVSACRKPHWLRPLQSPSMALRLRRWLDPRFAAAWDRDREILG